MSFVQRGENGVAPACWSVGSSSPNIAPDRAPVDFSANADTLGILGRGGGYIVAPSHELQTDVPTANITALYDAARRD